MNLELAARALDEVVPDARRAQTGLLAMDEFGFRAFYEETARPLLAYLVRASGDPHHAEDLWQEAYCRFLTSTLPVMDHRQARSYLFRIATNLMRDRWRRPIEEPMAESAPEPTSPDPHLDLRLDVRQAFQRLKRRERQLLWLAYVEGSNHEEIAQCTGLRAGSIRLLLFRARRRLAGLIGAKQRQQDSEVNK